MESGEKGIPDSVVTVESIELREDVYPVETNFSGDEEDDNDLLQGSGVKTDSLAKYSLNNSYRVRRKLYGVLKSVKNTLTLFPKSVYFIFATETAERYYYYGMRALLSIFFVSPKIGLSERTATLLYHSFVSMSYISPLFGGYISDTMLGNFWTIVFLSLLYVFGAALVAVSSFFSIIWLTLFGLFFVSVGTGGIKPCVSTFGADQLDGDEKMMTSYFHIFYFFINVGSFSSLIVSPILRVYTSFTVAFGFPTLLLSLSLAIFILGYPMYVHGKRHRSPLIEIAHVMFVATREKVKDPLSWKFLSLAVPFIGKQRVADMRSLFGVLRFFITLPIFWSLFDQQGSRWIFQGRQMVHKVPFLPFIEIRPEQMMVLNSTFVLLMIPIFERLIYPFFRKLGFKVTALRRVFVGMIVSMLAFVVSGILEIFIDLGYNVNILFQIPQYFLITIGELLCSITGLEHAYNMAPVSMKSAVMAFYHLTVAFGNIVVALTANISITDFLPFYNDPVANSVSSPFDYFFFAALMLICIIVFPFVNFRAGKSTVVDEGEVRLTEEEEVEEEGFEV